MKIAILAPESRTSAVTRLCADFCGVLCRHEVSASLAASEYIARGAGITPEPLFEYSSGAIEQVSSRVEYGSCGLVIALRDPASREFDAALTELVRRCDSADVPVATGLATARILLRSLAGNAGSASEYAGRIIR